MFTSRELNVTVKFGNDVIYINIQKHAAIPIVVIHGSEQLTKLRRTCSSGQTKKMWYSLTGFQGNPTTMEATRTVLPCVSMVNGMIILAPTF